MVTIDVFFALNVEQGISQDEKNSDQRILPLGYNFFFGVTLINTMILLIWVNFLVQLRATDSADIPRVRP